MTKASNDWRCFHSLPLRGTHEKSCSTDVEAPPARRRQFARDTLHRMGPFQERASRSDARSARSISNTSDKLEDVDVDDLISFYDQEVRKLQEAAGDKDHEPIAGNLYRYMALRSFAESSGLYQSQTKGNAIFFTGIVLAIFVQICTPLILWFWAWNQMDFASASRYPLCWCCEWKYEFGSDEYGLSNLFKRILGVIFIILFCANGIFIMGTDRFNMSKTIDLAVIFDAVSERSEELPVHQRYPPTHHFWLWLDPIVNVWCCSLCAACLLPLFSIAEDGPKDIVYDAFALLFLVNLDDIAGDLAFLVERWDADQFGDIFGKLADEVSQKDTGELTSLLEDIQAVHAEVWTPDDVYHFGERLLTALLVILPTCWIFLNAKAKASEADIQHEMHEQQISDLTVMVDVLQRQLADLTSQLRAKGALP